VFGDNKMTDENQPELEKVAKSSHIYVPGEGVFDSQEHLNASKTARGEKPYVPPLAEMSYTQEVLDYFKKPKDCSDKHIWTLY